MGMIEVCGLCEGSGLRIVQENGRPVARACECRIEKRVGRMLERFSRGFVVHVLLASCAISKGDLGGGQNQPHPHRQFFELVSSAPIPSASEASSNPATAA